MMPEVAPAEEIIKILFTLPDGNCRPPLHVHGNCRKMKR
jgi:hypothetical protein